MLTEDQIRAILTVAMGYDNRRPGALNIAAWQEASARGRWTFHDAVEAIHQHYAESPDFVMPGHITTRLRRAKQGPAPYLGLPAADPAGKKTRERIMELVQDQFALPKDLRDHPPRRGAPASAEHTAARERARAELDRIRRESEAS